MQREADVVVVGAGIVGCATAPPISNGSREATWRSLPTRRGWASSRSGRASRASSASRRGRFPLASFSQSRSSVHDEAAGDIDRLAGHVPGSIRREEADHVGHILRALHAAERHLGDAKRSMEIFKLNQDTLKDPNLIKVGQKIKLPPKSH